jgi:hypothetical protein
MQEKGEIVMVVMVFVAIFAGVFAGLANMLLYQGKVQTDKENQGSAFQIAESGLNYYRWYLAHNPTDLQNGTGGAGPYQIEYKDAEGNPVGKYSLQVAGNVQCGQVSAVDITSTGWTYDNPSLKKTVSARYARPSVAKYAYVLNSNVWMGSTESVHGPFYSNGGIHMDATNDATVSSKLPTWTCTSTWGCSGSQTKPGVFGSGPGSALWIYPAQWIDFSGIASSFTGLRTTAKASGLYFGLSSASGNCHGNHGNGNGYAYGNCNSNSQGHQNDGDLGWHFVFKSDGTVDVSRVKSVTTVWGQDINQNNVQDGYIIKTETQPESFLLPGNCSLAFVEDNAWIEGTVKGKQTIVVANIDAVSGAYRDVVIHGNLNYTTTTGTDGLTVVAQRNIMMPLDSPDTLSLNGIFVAQSGLIGRNYYEYVQGGNHNVPSQYKNYVTRTGFSLNGTIVQNISGATEWVNNNGACVSGYCSDTNSYDANLANNPPAMTPFTSVDYQFLKWNEVR